MKLKNYLHSSSDISYPKRADALKVRKVIQGLIIAHRQAVDLSILAPSDTRSKSEEVGKVKGYDSES